MATYAKNAHPIRFYSKYALTELMAPLAHYAAIAANDRNVTVLDIINEIADPKSEPKFNHAIRYEFAILYQARIKEVFPQVDFQATLFGDRPVEVVGIRRPEVTVNDFDKMRASVNRVAQEAARLGFSQGKFDLDFYFDRRGKRL